MTTIGYKRSILDQANGTYFSVVFEKKDGTLRKITGKKWEQKHLRAAPGVNTNPVAHKPEYYTMVENGVGFRNVNLNTLRRAVVRGKTYIFD